MRPYAPQLEKVIEFEMRFLQNDEHFLVAMILYEIIMPCWIKNQNIGRTAGQNPYDLEKKIKTNYPEGVPNIVVRSESWFDTPFLRFAGQTDIKIVRH